MIKNNLGYWCTMVHEFGRKERRIAKLSKNKLKVATRPIPSSFSQALKDNIGVWIWKRMLCLLTTILYYFIINFLNFKWDLWANLQTGGCRRPEVPWMHLQWPPLCPPPEDSLFSLRTWGHQFCPPNEGLIMNCFFLSTTGWPTLQQCWNFRTICARLGTEEE